VRKKYFAFSEAQISRMVALFRALEEGRYASSRTLSAGCDGRGWHQLTSDVRADGKGVWS
jgi:hypothetical protein